MSWSKYKYIYAGLILIFVISGLISFFLVRPTPQTRPLPIVKSVDEEVFKVTETTIIELFREYIVCQKYGLNCETYPINISQERRKELNGKSVEEITELYPKEENWLIEKIADNILKIINLNEGLCPTHKKIWHLGENSSKDYIAVFYGPRDVKDEGGIYKVTEIPIKNLPLDFQERVRNHSIEFYQEDELIATLDTLSEFLE